MLSRVSLLFKNRPIFQTDKKMTNFIVTPAVTFAKNSERLLLAVNAKQALDIFHVT